MIGGLSHITIAVSDIDVSLDFYAGFLGFRPIVRWDGGIYLEAGSLWLCLSLDNPAPSTDYSHIAFRIEASVLENCKHYIDLREIPQWKENSSEGDSIYVLDPDGHKIELHVGNLDSRLDFLKSAPYSGLKWLS
tara:strand:- start:1748 stop:2149 length:402 start_codon:yes stop_codon:yes gene_type:complete